MKKIILIALLIIPFFSHGTHWPSGEITIEHSTGNAYTINLKVLVDRRSSITFGNGTLSFGDGTTYTTPETNSTIIPGDQFTGMVLIRIVHTYDKPGWIVVSYEEHNLAGSI